MRQSISIILQCINQIPEGSIKTDNKKLTTPSKKEMKKSMEALIHHFKLYSMGTSLPKNETYVATEAPKGEFLKHL
jgi:NADH:ubiquinone oxidoreductase subunit D